MSSGLSGRVNCPPWDLEAEYGDVWGQGPRLLVVSGRVPKEARRD